MKTYKKYYEEFKDECLKNMESDKSLWRKKTSISDDVNDMSIVENRTQVPNSEWVILHHVLVQLLTDYVKEHPLKNEVYTYGVDIDLIDGKWKIFLNDQINVNITFPDSDVDYNLFESECVTDEEVLNSYDELTERIFFFICKFMSDRRNKLKGLRLNKVFFNMDDINCSLKLGKWAPETDSSMTIYSDDVMYVCSM